MHHGEGGSGEQHRTSVDLQRTRNLQIPNIPKPDVSYKKKYLKK